VLDCTSQLELIDMIDEDEFRAVLRANFAKSRRDQAHFDRLYHLFFHELRGDLSDDEGMPRKAGQVIDTLRGRLNGDREYRAIIEFLSGDPFMFLDMMRQVQSESDSAGIGAKFNLGPLSSRLKVLLSLNRVRDEIGRFSTGINCSSTTPCVQA
jgi:hypothetical protein